MLEDTLLIDYHSLCSTHLCFIGVILSEFTSVFIFKTQFYPNFVKISFLLTKYLFKKHFQTKFHVNMKRMIMQRELILETHYTLNNPRKYNIIQKPKTSSKAMKLQ